MLIFSLNRVPTAELSLWQTNSAQPVRIKLGLPGRETVGNAIFENRITVGTDDLVIWNAGHGGPWNAGHTGFWHLAAKDLFSVTNSQHGITGVQSQPVPPVTDAKQTDTRPASIAP
jgi:hypothetical protein